MSACPAKAIRAAITESDFLIPRMTYRLFGKWTEYRNKHSGKTEKQFTFSTFVQTEPLSQAGVVHYLTLCPRIGPAIADAIYAQHGNRAVQVLRESPDLVAADIPSLAGGVACAAAEFLRDKQATEACMIELLSLLKGRGGPKKTPQLAMRRWGNRAPRVIAKDPFVLLDLPGWGFGRCDAMYLDLGYPHDALRRQMLCVWHAVASDTSGHTWVSSDVAKAVLQGSIAGAKPRFEDAVQAVLNDGRLKARWTDNQGRDATIDGVDEWLADRHKASDEHRIALFANEMFRYTSQWGLKFYPFSTLSGHQLGTLATVINDRISILGGSPGTGKTFTAAALIDAVCRQHGKDAVAVCAPTGKAAVRISEAMADLDIPIHATTAHVLLESQFSPEGGWSFRRNRANRLKQKYVICDEGSMVDAWLMARLLAATDGQGHLLFVADINQLPPVGHGAPLRDMIAAGVPYGELTEIHRNGGRIVEACRAIREGRQFDVTPPFTPHPLAEPGLVEENLVMRTAHGAESQWVAIRNELAVAKNNELDPIWDAQVLVALNTHGPLSRRVLNAKLQDYLNPDGEAVKGSPFRVGDKVVNTANSMFRGIDDYGAAMTTYVANGDMAEVVDVDVKYFDALLPGHRIVRVPRGPQENDDSGHTTTGCSWELGYALSVHKSQGSEWPFVIVGLDPSPAAQRVCSREWLYTAISRAKRACTLVGLKATADNYCRRRAIGLRKTFLQSLLVT